MLESGLAQELKALFLIFSSTALVWAGLPIQIHAQDLTNNLIFYAPFNTSLDDIQGGKTATAAGGASRMTLGGVSGGFLHLINDATIAEEYIYYPDPTPATGDFSFQVWVRSANPQSGQTSGDPAIASNKDWDSGGNVGWVLAEEDLFSDSDKFQWNMNTVGGARKDLDPVGVSGAIVFDRRWHQLAITYQRNGSAVFYRDGVGIGSVDISANAGQSIRPAFGTWVTNSILALGQDATLRYDHASGSGVTSFNGDLDEVAMWGRVLTASDVRNAYSKATNGLTLDSPLPPTFMQQPQGGSRYAGENFLFSCTVAGDPAPVLQWLKDNAVVNEATNSDLLLTNLASSDAASYSVTATGGGISITSSPAILSVLCTTEPSGTIKDVRHVVIFMQENRSFDHYFGSLRGVHGFGDRNALRFQNGKTDFYQPDGGNDVLPIRITTQCVAGTSHDWTTTHQGWNSGKWDQWIPAKGITTMAYYSRSDLAFYYALAEAFTICDAYHCSVMGPTNPNRLYLWTGMVDPNGSGGGPIIDNSEPAAGFTWTTYPERLQAAGITWKVYQGVDNYDDNALAWFAQYKKAMQGNPLYDRGIATVSDLAAAFENDVTSGALPQVSWIIAAASDSEHPTYSPANGEVLTQKFLNVLAANPAVYKSTVFILTYDENDGLFDHVPAPVPPAGTPAEFVGGLPIGLGVRVPTILVSPWSRGGYVCSQVFDHSSIIRFLEQWTGVAEPNISNWRRKICGDLTSAFDFKNPNTNFPSLPSVTGVNCGNGVVPDIPPIQTMPAQEGGTLIARPLPYQLNASSYTDCTLNRFYIVMTNSGAAAVHYAIYANAYRTDGPWQYDAAASNGVADYFSIAGVAYDLTCYGPNGFQRRFAGSANCSAIEVNSSVDANSQALILSLSNPTASSQTFSVSNGLSGSVASFNLGANSGVTNVFLTEDSNGWYDLTVTVDSDPVFLRRLAGHIETVVPKITAAITSGILVLNYPDWANGYVLESNTNLAMNAWLPVMVSPSIVSNRTVVMLNNSMNAVFFRLRH